MFERTSTRKNWRTGGTPVTGALRQAKEREAGETLLRMAQDAGAENVTTWVPSGEEFASLQSQWSAVSALYQTTREPSILWSLVRTPLIGGTLIRGRSANKEQPNAAYYLKSPDRALRVTRVTMRRSIRTWMAFDKTEGGYQRLSDRPSLGIYGGPELSGASRALGVDGIALVLVRLTTLLTPLSRRASMENIGKKELEYYGAFVIMEGRMRAVFLVTDVRWFYVSFEAVLIPMYYRIGMYGSRERKIRAAYRFFRYTMAGSVRMLLGILYRNQHYGTTDMLRLQARMSNPETALDPEVARRRWLAFFRALAVKVPMVPVHVWLPEAHVEAPTGGSVILAGIRLKLGTYGMIRRLLGIFGEASVYYTPRVYMRAIVGIIYPARTAMRQTDMKRIVAYASVSHMNLTLIGMFSMTRAGVSGAIVQMISHGRVAGGRFMGIGVRYDRYHTRNRVYLGGLAQRMPRYAIIMRVLTMANIGLPGTSAFVGEWMMFVGIIQTNLAATGASRLGMILGAVYSRWMLNRIRYGNRKNVYGGAQYGDRNRRERRMFIPIIVGTILFGRQPSRILDHVHTNCVERLLGVNKMG
jgi:proton-translocating NADH-quinone oxidoreductase chain M